MEAVNQGYSLVCNKFDAQDTRMASIEYVFYLSKVRATCGRRPRSGSVDGSNPPTARPPTLRPPLILLAQILDFFDTFFIVTRGKWDQFSFLHCYHHLSIFLTYWCGARRQLSAAGEGRRGRRAQLPLVPTPPSRRPPAATP